MLVLVASKFGGVEDASVLRAVVLSAMSSTLGAACSKHEKDMG
jgi:hypothetical protein